MSFDSEAIRHELLQQRENIIACVERGEFARALDRLAFAQWVWGEAGMSQTRRNIAESIADALHNQTRIVGKERDTLLRQAIRLMNGETPNTCPKIYSGAAP